MNEQRASQALRALYDLVMEYDLEIILEESGNEVDLKRENTFREEYAKVVGVFAEVREVLKPADA